MSVKGMLINILGQNFLSDMKGMVYHYGCSAGLTLKGRKKLKYDNSRIELVNIFTDKDFNIFRGYYDIDYMSRDGLKFLCSRLPLKAKNNREAKNQIGFYDLASGEFVKIAETSAWCWQQGSRLRWLNEDEIIFNDADRNGYCARTADVKSGKPTGVIPCPLYDFTPDFKYGLSLNYSRLQRLRPGYGYDYFEDKTKGQNAPEDDGVFLADLRSGKTSLMYSLKELSETAGCEKDFVHYINHICVSPKGDKFMFFHIYMKPGVKGWNTVLYVSDINGSRLKALETADRSSHYCWTDNNNLMVTCRKADGREYYCLFNTETGKKQILENSGLCVDGHPGLLGGGSFLTDTYPQKMSLQKLKTFGIGDSRTNEIASIYHDYRLRGEIRCDLHPSVTADGRYFSVDTTFQGKRRSVILFKIKDIREN